MIDGRGEKLEVGDTVVYPVRGGSSMWMVEAVVKLIRDDGTIQVERQDEYPYALGEGATKRLVTLRDTGRVTKINEKQVTIDDLAAWVKKVIV